MTFHTDQILRYLLKGIIVADHEKLTETPNIHHLAGQRFSADIVKIGGRFIEEGDVDIADLSHQGEAHSQRRAHLLAAG